MAVVLAGICCSGSCDSSGWHVTIDRELAVALVEHYRDDPAVGSVPDALRAAAREVLDCE